MRRTALLMMLLAILFGNRLTLAQNQAVCLQYDDSYADRTVINITTGEKTGGAVGNAINAATDLPRYPPPVIISPDEKQAAIQYQTLTGDYVFALYPAYDPRATLNLANDANDGLYHYDIKWSPDSQWLSYLTFREDDGFYLSLMDTTGHITQTMLISTRFEDSVSSFGWSSDGRYLALSVFDSKSGSVHKIEIWSTPDLKRVRLIKPVFSVNGPRLEESVETPDVIQYPDRIQWSSQGSILAYLDYYDNGLDGRLTLNIYTPDDDKIKTYPLPDINDPYHVGMAWSPDGQAVAVVTTHDDTTLTGRIDALSLKDMVMHTVSEKVMHYIIYNSGGGGTDFPYMHWSGDGHALFFVEQPPTQSHTLGILKAYIPSSGQTVTLAPHVYMNPHVDASHRFLFALSPDDGIDHFGYINLDAPEQTPTTEDSIIVVDTNTFEVESVPALQNLPFLFQVYGEYSEVTGWLLLSEDGIFTWGINMRIGQQMAFYPPHFLYNFHGRQFYYFPVKDAEVVAGFKLQGGKAPSVTLLSLRDGSNRVITYPFTFPFYAIVQSSDENLLAVFGYNDTSVFPTLYILQADGTLLWQFANLGDGAHNFVFTTCA